MVYERRVGHYLIEVLLKTPAFVPERWEVSIQNGDNRKPSAESSTLDDALLFLLSVMDPAAIEKAYSAMSRHHMPPRIEALYQEAGLVPALHQQIVTLLRDNPELARHLHKLPDLSEIGDKVVEGRIISETYDV